MVYIFRRAPSDSANLLAEAIGGRRLRSFDGEKFWRRHPKQPVRVREGDTVVCWGETLPEIDGVKLLNNVTLRNKLTDATILQRAEVPTIETSRARTDGWLPRLSNHIGGHDLIQPPANADYWVRKEHLVEEFRIHCFRGKSIRAGVKVPREGVDPHEWIRSLDSGWRICYDGFKSKKAMRQLAASACEALGLDFGAVDIGRKKDKSYIVLEVNRAPGLEGGSVEAYARALTGGVQV